MSELNQIQLLGLVTAFAWFLLPGHPLHGAEFTTTVGQDRALATTPNDFFKRGTPTFVIGTDGNSAASNGIRAQVNFIGDLLFNRAKIVPDREIDVSKGIAAWPTNPVLYGGPHLNNALARLAPSLPFSMGSGKLVLGDQIFQGDDYRLIAVIPSREPDSSGPGYPQLLLYAGTGSPGVAEINAIHHGGKPILVADTFGPLIAGEWRSVGNGKVKPFFPKPRAHRIAWGTIERELPTGVGARDRVQIRFPAQIPSSPEDGRIADACVRGLARAVENLQITNPAPVTVYVYPDRASKRSLKGNDGDGEADVEAHAIHVIRFDSGPGGGIERMLSHEGTHVLTYYSWGAAGTPLLGEGVAVWVSGNYGGVTLGQWKSRLRTKQVSLARLLGNRFRQLPEEESYPLAGIFVEAIVEKIGVARLREHLYGASASNWEDCCRAAGTTSAELETAWRDRLSAR